jgi:pimeloyl-ACP methyl ester carboxylesterase
VPVVEETLRVGDVDIRLLRGGQGKPLLFLHGSAGLPPWNAFFEQLSAQHEVLVTEHPGFGRTVAPQWIRNVADMAMYYLDVLDRLGHERVHLVGHSLGGWIAAEAAARNCSRLATLSLLAPAGLRVRGVPIGDNFIWSVEETARNLFFDQSLAEGMLAQTPSEEEADLQLTNRFMAAKLGWEPRWFNPSLENWLHRVRVPSLVLWGAADKLFPSSYSKAWEARLPDAEVKIIEDCGHLPHIEKPQATAQCLAAFLAGKQP